MDHRLRDLVLNNRHGAFLPQMLHSLLHQALLDP